MPNLDFRSVRDFAKTLSCAVADKRAARSSPEVFLFDADVALKLILGLTIPDALLGNVPFQTTPPLAVRALLSLGWFGKIRLLRPHLVEFDRKLHELPNPHTALSSSFRDAHRSYLVRTWHLDNYDGALRKLSEVPPEQASALFGDFVLQNGFDVFVKCELTYGGTWRHRLRRFLENDLFCFEPIAEADRFDASSEEARSLYDALGRHPDRTESTENNLVDAPALALLVEFVATDRHRNIRFLSETKALWELPRDPETLNASEVLERSKGLLRDHQYFLLRASFDALAPDEPDGPRLSWGSSVGLDELAAMAEELLEVTRTSLPEGKLASTLSSLTVGGEPLQRVLRDYYDYRLLGNILQAWRPPDDLAALLPDLGRSFAREEYRQAADVDLQTAFERVSRDLKKRLGGLRSWRMSFERIRVGPKSGEDVGCHQRFA